MAAYVRADGNTINYTPGTAVAGGEVVVVSEYLIGVATSPIAANALGSLQIEGIVEVDKASGALSAGDVVYFDEADDEVNTDSGNPFFGKVVEAAESGDATVKVKLCPQWSFAGS